MDGNPTRTVSPVAQTRPSSMSVNDLLSRPSSSQDGRKSSQVEQRQDSQARPLFSHTSSSASTASASLGRETFSSRRPITPMGGSGMEITPSENVNAYQYAAVQQITENRENIEYILSVREQPKHSRMCGVGEKADRRPIDPAPIIQLRVIVHDHPCPTKANDAKATDSSSSVGQGNRSAAYNGAQVKPQSHSNSGPSEYDSRGWIRRGVPVRTEWGEGWEDKTWYLENPYYFMYAMLADAETDEELHLLGDRRTRYTTGSCVSCLYHLKDIDGTEQGFFVFPDLSIRVEGYYRLKLCLFETIGHEVHHCKSIYSQPFNVYTAKRFPGMEESTPLSKSFADQGLKVRVRKNPRARRARALGNKRKGDSAGSEDESDTNGQATNERKEVSHSSGPSLANKRPRGDMLHTVQTPRHDDGGEPFNLRGRPYGHLQPHQDHIPQRQQSTIEHDRRNAPMYPHEYTYARPQPHPYDEAAWRADRERREYGQPAPLLHGHGVQTLESQPPHPRPPLHAMPDRRAEPIMERHGPQPHVAGYGAADRALHEPHPRPSLESRRSEPYRPVHEQDRYYGPGGYRPGPPGEGHDMPPFRERAMNGREIGQRGGGGGPGGMMDGEQRHRMQTMQRPPPPPEGLGVPSWQSPRSASPVHTRAVLANDYARDRSISDPYRSVHSHPVRAPAPAPGGVVSGAVNRLPPVNDDQRHRLPPLHVALSPETATRPIYPSPSDPHYHSRSAGGGGNSAGAGRHPQIPSPLQQHSGMPGLQARPPAEVPKPALDGPSTWEGTPANYGPPPPPAHQQFYHRVPSSGPYAPPPPGGQQPGAGRSASRGDGSHR